MKTSRTNIVIEDSLMTTAMKVSGLKTKREVVAEALRALIDLKNQAKIRSYRGKLKWAGDLDVLRGRA